MGSHPPRPKFRRSTVVNRYTITHSVNRWHLKVNERYFTPPLFFSKGLRESRWRKLLRFRSTWLPLSLSTVFDCITFMLRCNGDTKETKSKYHRTQTRLWTYCSPKPSTIEKVKVPYPRFTSFILTGSTPHPHTRLLTVGDIYILSHL